MRGKVSKKFRYVKAKSFEEVEKADYIEYTFSFGHTEYLNYARLCAFIEGDKREGIELAIKENRIKVYKEIES